MPKTSLPSAPAKYIWKKNFPSVNPPKLSGKNPREPASCRYPYEEPKEKWRRRLRICRRGYQPRGRGGTQAEKTCGNHVHKECFAWRRLFCRRTGGTGNERSRPAGDPREH